jgi:protein gp37
MAKDTKIEWTHHTFNPWWGCTKVSSGCDNCYADNMARRYGHDVWGHDSPRRFLSNATWDQPLIWNNEAAAAGIRKRVFCASMADVFEVREDLETHRLRLLKMIGGTNSLDWLLLTKRPHSIKKLLPLGYQFPPNVWIGTTAENQESADKRIKYLQDFTTPSVRFLSCEPLLGPIDISRYLKPGRNGVRIDWVICGGESEHGARPMNPKWAESLLEQCQEADVPFLFKQWGNWAPASEFATGRKPAQVTFSSDHGQPVRLVRVGKKASGRLLLGRTWDEYPTPSRTD